MSNINTPLQLLIQLAKFQSFVGRKFDQLSVHGLGFNDLLVLHALYQAPKEKLRRIDLAESIGVTASGITRMLLPMEKNGWVTREVSERDARIGFAVLTPAGKRLYKEAIKTADKIAASIIPADQLTNGALLTMIQFLDTVLR
jgi:DNA-binding MarR family transcriptional regulator